MFDFVRNNKKFIQLVMAVLMLPFALWGVESYVRPGATEGVATVGGIAITTAEFQQSLREQQERYRTQMGEKADQAMLESAQFRQQVLQDLVNQRLLGLYASQAKLRVSDEALAGFIRSVPSLQENGKFSRERYQGLVAAQGMSIEMFEARVRQDIVMQQAMLAASNGAVTGKMPADRWLAAQIEERLVSEAILRPEQYVGDGKPDAATVKRYYEEHRSKFEKPEQVRVAYVVLSQEKISGEVKVDEAALRGFYQSREGQYKQPEQRRASHILIRVDAKASEAEVKAANEKAEQVLVQLKSGAADFAKLAKQYSQDPGSAERGGDLGYFGRGMMVKPFEESVFGLTENQLSDVVRSDFGFHLIKLTGIRTERVRPFDEVRSEITRELKRQLAAKQYAEAAEGFGNIVYEQADDLKPVAEKYGLAIQETSWIAASGNLQAPFDHAKLIKAVFSEDAIRNKRNTEAIDVGGNTLVAARVIEHRPAAAEPLESVASTVEQLLMREVAMAKVLAVGKEMLGKLQKGESVDVKWAAPRPLSRMQAGQLSPQARREVFGAVAKTLPAYVGAQNGGSYVLYRIEKITPYVPAKAGNAAPLDQFLRQQYNQMVAQEELSGWLAALRQRFPVSINNQGLERSK